MRMEGTDTDQTKSSFLETDSKTLQTDVAETDLAPQNNLLRDQSKDSSNSDDDWVKEPESYLSEETEKSILDSIDTRKPLKQPDEDGWLDILGSGQLKKKILHSGEGSNTRPERGNLVTIRCEGRLDTGKIIDCHDNLRFTLGDGDVIQAFDLSVALMEKGEVAEIVVNPRFAYGHIGSEPEIPSDSNITYEVELLDVQRQPDIETLTFAERRKLGDEKRERGNYWFTRGEYTLAIDSYRRALDILDDENKSHDDVAENLQQLLETRLKVINNLGAAQMKIEAYDAALKSVELVLRVQPDNVKALFRKGKMLALKGETKEAMEVLRKALKHEPESKIIHTELTKLSSKLKSDVQLEKDMYKRMLGNEGNDKITSPIASPSKFQIQGKKWGLIVGAAAIAVVGTVLYKYL